MNESSDDLPGELRRDGLTALVTLAISLVLAIAHFRQGGRLHRDYGADPGPAMVPELLLTVLAGLGLLILVITLVRSLATGIRPAGLPTRSEMAAIIYPVGLLASLVVYVIVLPRVGFLISTPGLACLWCLLLAMQGGRRMTPAAILLLIAQGAVITGLVYVTFRFLLRVPLP